MLIPELVLLGGPNSGKTHYAGQLYGRLQRNPGALRLRREEGAPSDLSSFQEVLNCLENGNAASHTPKNTWTEVVLPLTDNNGRTIDLRWPDYGGEQLRDVFTLRSVNKNWNARLIDAKGWLIFIRLNAEVTHPDALANLTNQKHEIQNEPTRAKQWDANAYWIEVLQILLHVAGLGIVRPLQSPRLAVLLSCYDELDVTNCQPLEVLKKKLPLVASFMENNWATNEVSVWGLSSLGQQLTANSNIEAFIDEGPEYQGWVIPPEGGMRNKDISLPIKWMLDGLK